MSSDFGLKGTGLERTPMDHRFPNEGTGRMPDGKKVTLGGLEGKGFPYEIDKILIPLEETFKPLNERHVKHKKSSSSNIFYMLKRLVKGAVQKKSTETDLSDFNKKLEVNRKSIDTIVQSLKNLRTNSDKILEMVKEKAFNENMTSDEIKRTLSINDFEISKDLIKQIKKLIPLIRENIELREDSRDLETVSTDSLEESDDLSVEDSNYSVGSSDAERGLFESQSTVSSRFSRSRSTLDDNESMPRSERIIDGVAEEEFEEVDLSGVISSSLLGKDDFDIFEELPNVQKKGLKNDPLSRLFSEDDYNIFEEFPKKE